MWIPASLLSLLTMNKDTLDSLRLEAATLRGKNEILERELTAIRINSDWMRARVNQVEAERSVLMEKAFPGLSLPVPEIARVANRVRSGFDLQSLFEDQSSDSDTPAAN